VTNEHKYVTKMAQGVAMGSLWGDFIVIFWIVKIYLQRLIYFWNKTSKRMILDVEWIFILSLYT
jgi:hypothetical protein